MKNPGKIGEILTAKRKKQLDKKMSLSYNVTVREYMLFYCAYFDATRHEYELKFIRR